ncbi:MAG TPA: type II toxin-antitoxin system Phd/YefM family antitoxin [Gammaproteobacteria bacterium]|jgi:prevent-host-death family protein|nr:type II toxin-antitoxin system Phd/YefM family antitoxin [Gammaproteobacteria bacterium]
MKTLPLSEVKMKLSALIENIRATDEEIIITKNGYPAAVLISPEEFDGWRETIAIQNDAQLLAEIKQGLAELKTKQTNLYTLEELFEA